MSSSKQSNLLDIFKSRKKSGGFKTFKSKQLKSFLKNVNTANAIIVPKNPLLFSNSYVRQQNNDIATVNKGEINHDESVQPETSKIDEPIINSSEDEASSSDEDSFDDNVNDDDEAMSVISRNENRNFPFDQNLFINDLVCWAIKYNVNHVQLKGLLKIWNEHVPLAQLPLDPRTLLCTPRVLNFIDEADKFWYYGLQKSIIQLNDFIDIPNHISLNVNIDGMPPFKSSKMQIWPILFNIHELKNVSPMAIAIYCGEGKNNFIFKMSLYDLFYILSKYDHISFIFQKNPMILKCSFDRS